MTVEMVLSVTWRLVAVLLTVEHSDQPVVEDGGVRGADDLALLPQLGPLRPAVVRVLSLLLLLSKTIEL